MNFYKNKKFGSTLIKLLFPFSLVYIAANLYIQVCFSGQEVELMLRPKVKVAFNHEIWKEGEYELGGRYPMANDILKRKLLISLSKDQLIDLLGLPKSKQNCHKEIAYCEYIYPLAPQDLYPAKSFMMPFLRCGNLETWVLVVKISNGYVAEGFIGIA